MIESWMRPAEQIAHFAAMGGASVLGFLSIGGDAGVTTLSRTVCEILSRSNTQTLLVDLTSPVSERAATAGETSGCEILWRRLPAGTRGYPSMVASPTASTRYLFNNVALLQQIWEHELGTHSMLVLDLPPVLGERSDLVNSLAAAVSCDALFLVCLQGSTNRARLAEAMTVLRAARVNPTRLVINQRDYSSPAEEIARTARKLRMIAPGLAAAAARRALNSDFLR